MAKGQLLKGASVLAVSQLIVAVCTFARNIVVARLISVEDYGIATTFALTMSLIEMTSNLAFDRILVQDGEGGSDRMLASAHFLQFIKSLLLAAILYTVASPVALYFELPELVWAYQMLAVIPLIRGLTHFDVISMQRDMQFVRTAIIDAVPQILVLVLAYFIARWLGDYRVMLVAVIFQASVALLGSHLLAKRPYRWLVDKALVKKKLRFGWPLMINGLLMFAIFQGDKAIVGAQFDMETLGWYSAAFSLTMLPTLVFAKIGGTVLLPLMSKSQNNPEQFYQHAVFSSIVCAGAGLFFLVFFVIGGTSFLILSFGMKYAEGATLMAWLGLMQAFRMFRVAPTIVSTSQADTTKPMYANIVRTIALVLAVVAVYLEFPVVWVAISGVIGELAATVFSLLILKMSVKKGVFVRKSMVYAMLMLGAFALTQFFISGWLPHTATVLSHLVNIVVAGLIGLCFTFLMVLTDGNTRRQLLLIPGLLKGKYP